MGNTESTTASATTPTLTTRVHRYTSMGYPYGGGKAIKEYIYVSKFYDLEIHPGNRACPIKSYDKSYWDNITDRPEIIQVPSSLFEEAAEFLKQKDSIENKIQMMLTVHV